MTNPKNKKLQAQYKERSKKLTAKCRAEKLAAYYEAHELIARAQVDPELVDGDELDAAIRLTEDFEDYDDQDEEDLPRKCHFDAGERSNVRTAANEDLNCSYCTAVFKGVKGKKEHEERIRRSKKKQI